MTCTRCQRDRPVRAKGLCSSCYEIEWRSTHPRVRPTVTCSRCHREDDHGYKSLCGSCYHADYRKAHPKPLTGLQRRVLVVLCVSPEPLPQCHFKLERNGQGVFAGLEHRGLIEVAGGHACFTKRCAKLWQATDAGRREAEA